MLLKRTGESNTIRRLLMDAESLKAKDGGYGRNPVVERRIRSDNRAGWMSASKRSNEIDEMKSITDNYLTKLQNWRRDTTN